MITLMMNKFADLTFVHTQNFFRSLTTKRSIWQPSSQLFAGEARDAKKSLARNGVFAFPKDV